MRAPLGVAVTTRIGSRPTLGLTGASIFGAMQSSVHGSLSLSGCGTNCALSQRPYARVGSPAEIKQIENQYAYLTLTAPLRTGLEHGSDQKLEHTRLVVYLCSFYTSKGILLILSLSNGNFQLSKECRGVGADHSAAGD